MLSKRLLAIAKNVFENDTVLDVGCDHGYLSLYLKKNKLCKEVYASDISDNALNVAKENFQKENVKIKTFLSDGFKDINIFFDTAVISGMGTNTILEIINNEKCPNKLIISSNNDNYLLRKSLNKLGIKIVDEEQVLERGHYYIVLYCLKNRKQKLNKRELKYGISNNEEYYTYLIQKNRELMQKVPFKKKIKLLFECLELYWVIKRK